MTAEAKKLSGWTAAGTDAGADRDWRCKRARLRGLRGRTCRGIHMAWPIRAAGLQRAPRNSRQAINPPQNAKCTSGCPCSPSQHYW